jgi:hypothetical protein
MLQNAAIAMAPFEFTQSIPPGFHISVREEGATWFVECSGVLDTPDACSAVQPQLLMLHGALVAAQVSQVNLNLRGVEYMNSGGLKSFMAWFLSANQEQDRRYRIEVAYDPNRSWQPISLRPMERLAPKVVHLTPPPGAL